MNIHRTSAYNLTTTSDTPDGGSVDLEALGESTLLLESQCTVQAHVPQDVRLRVVAQAPQIRVLVEGGILPSGTLLQGVLSVVSARP